MGDEIDFHENDPVRLNQDELIERKKTINLKKFSPVRNKTSGTGTNNSFKHKQQDDRSSLSILTASTVTSLNHKQLNGKSESMHNEMTKEQLLVVNGEMKNHNIKDISETHLGSCFDLTETETCIICGKLYEKHETEKHFQNCKSSKLKMPLSLSTKSVRQKITCEICNKDISMWNIEKRLSHTNK